MSNPFGSTNQRSNPFRSNRNPRTAQTNPFGTGGFDFGFSGLDNLDDSPDEDEGGFDDLGVEFDDDSSQALFKLRSVKFALPDNFGRFVRCAAAKNILVIATENNYIVRWNHQQNERTHCPIKNEDSVRSMFLDPTSYHCIVSFSSRRSYYINFSKNSKMKPILLSKIKGKLIESVLWNPTNTSSVQTGEILLGMRSGEIFVSTINDQAQKSASLVYNLSEGSSEEPICSMELHLWEPSARSQKFYLVIATPKRFYELTGPPSFTAVFAKYSNQKPEATKELFARDPSKLFLARPQGYSLAQRLVWATTPGIMDATLLWGAGDRVVQWDQTNEILQWGEDGEWGGVQEGEMPIGMEITEFHYLLLYPDRFIAVNRLNQECVLEQTISSNYHWIQMCANREDFYFVISERVVWQVEFQEPEDRDVWQIYLEKKKYGEAKRFAKNYKQRTQVIQNEADYYFRQNKFDQAARKYADLMDERGRGPNSMSFEEITLKFVDAEETDALRTFLKARLDRLPPHDRTRRAMLCCWLTELHLQRMDEKRFLGDMGKQMLTDATLEFKEFLRQNHDALPKETTFDLIASHGYVEELMLYAELKNEFRFVIQHYVETQKYHKALQVFQERGDNKSLVDLYYDFAPVLMHHVPRETVDLLLQRDLDARIIPNLIQYQTKRQMSVETQREVTRYLEHCVQKTKNKVVHNYLITLYCAERNEEGLRRFIRATKKCPYYDCKYALRLCHVNHMLKACVDLYKIMHLYEDAVQLALGLDDECELAKSVAKEYELSTSHKQDTNPKRLWMMIARYLVEEMEKSEIALKLVSDCRHLSIEDILPYLEEFTSLGNYRELIIDSLEKYQDSIKSLQSKMETLAETSSKIKEDIDSMKDRSQRVTSNQKCDLSGKPLFGRPFVVFPCQHVFSLDALVEKLNEHRGRHSQSFIPMDISEQEKVDLVCKECPLCGDIMIEEVTTSFLLSKEEIARWRI